MTCNGSVNGVDGLDGTQASSGLRRRCRGARAGLVVALASGAALAQPTMHAPVITLDWPGGTVGKYIEALRSASREAVINVVLDADLSSWDVGPMKLTGVTSFQALQAGAAAARGEGGGRVVVEDQSTRGGAPGAGFAVLSAIRPGRSERPTDLGVLPLRSLVESLPDDEGGEGASVEVVLSAVETGLNLADADGRPAQLQFHQPSYLLMVQGDGSEIEAASRIVSLLSRDVSERHERQRRAEAAALEERVKAIAEATSGDAEAAVVELNAERRRMALMHEQAQLELAARDADAAQLKQLHERGMTSDAELRQAEFVRNRARVETNVLASEIQRIEDRLALVQSRADGGSEEALEAAAARLRERLEAARAREAELHRQLEVAVARRGVDANPADIERTQKEIAQAHAEGAELEARLSAIAARREASQRGKIRLEEQAQAVAAEAEVARREAAESRTRLELLQGAIEDERRARLMAEERVQQMVAEMTQLRVEMEMLRAELAKREGRP